MSPSPTDTCWLSLSITEGETDYLYRVTSRHFTSVRSAGGYAMLSSRSLMFLANDGSRPGAVFKPGIGEFDYLNTSWQRDVVHLPQVSLVIVMALTVLWRFV